MEAALAVLDGAGLGVAEVVRERGDRYPSVTAALAEAAGGGEDEALGFGLDLILDGLRARIGDAGPPRHRPDDAGPNRSDTDPTQS